MFINLADDPPIERLILPRTALTAAEYLAYDLDLHVLVVMTDMTHYAEALREVATAKGDVPARKGYPGYLYSDLAEIYERAGRIRNTPRLNHHDAGRVHAVRRHHPPDPGSHRLHHRGSDRADAGANNQGIYPPVDISAVVVAADEGRHRQGSTRARIIARVAAPALRLLCARAGSAQPRLHHRRGGSVRGGPASFLTFADAFERRFVGQGEDEDRSIVETLNLAWDLLSLLPPEALTRVGES